MGNACGSNSKVEHPQPAKVNADGASASNTPAGAPAPASAALAATKGEPPGAAPSGSKMLEQEEPADDDLLLNIFYPEDIAKRSSLPLIVYQHGRGCTAHVYKPLFAHWVSMGFVVVFPHKHDSAVMGEDPPWPSTTLDDSPDGIEMQLALKRMISKANADKSSVFFNRIDTKNLALGGHSMGGKSAICAGAQIEPHALLLHSPSCSAEGSEVYDLSKEQIEDRFAGLAKDRTPIMLMTNDEDVGQEKVLSVFHAPKLAKCPRIYVQYSKAACAKCESNIVKHCEVPRTIFDREFMINGPLGLSFRAHCYIGAGGEHDPSLKWGDIFMKLYLTHKGDKSCKEYEQIWGDGPDSLKKDPNVTQVLISTGE
mmetsp:Transcript_20346/g.49978  ORF Transcript_20346/g.49978 Transcript_20346/m.49978 type:complete len:369 (+) Transcript_20346:181-1287(+)|eukprot:CAMPEP_0206237734 /NCGR_PEP_ID=MMETSP0047_2-20121206/14426_1 /ASSEMBLY_ACC=CAM_ASM_000192 /TAXON_ID=195065 /ORGANISM="Chroomonas mesostigmatica_cf, Strain CCMP1168" /LENGTH=368 /DNA_ID=CAMNT_0053662195 /DNA_START=174 /DNA_END=1280 /DNA_ORIENTATION=-